MTRERRIVIRLRCLVIFESGGLAGPDPGLRGVLLDVLQFQHSLLIPSAF